MSSDPIKRRILNQFSNMQPGLVYASKNAHFFTFKARAAPLDRKKIADAHAHLRGLLNSDKSGSCNSVVFGVTFATAEAWAAADRREAPRGVQAVKALSSDDLLSPTTIFGPSSPFAQSVATGSENGLWIHVKTDATAADGGSACFEHFQAAVKFCKTELAQSLGLAEVFDQAADSRRDRVLGCQFAENVNNPSDAISFAAHTLNADGSSYVVAQRFFLNWEHILQLSSGGVEDLIGRRADGTDSIIPLWDTRSHIKCSRQRNEHGDTAMILRLGLPFGHAADVARTTGGGGLKYTGGGAVQLELGNYFAGFNASPLNLLRVLRGQLGNARSNLGGADIPRAQRTMVRDRLFNVVTSDAGVLCYVPGMPELYRNSPKLFAAAAPSADSSSSHSSIKQLTGTSIDWNRVVRHYRPERANSNDLFHFNHRDYLWRMSLYDGSGGSPPSQLAIQPPSWRILMLAENHFTRWSDAWYLSKSHLDLGHIKDYPAELLRDLVPELPASASDAQVVAAVMKLPIAVRRAASIRETLRAFHTAEFGCRGPRASVNRGKPVKDGGRDGDGYQLEGKDTFYIHPLSIIVGSMPDLSIGQGYDVLLYLTEEERQDAYFRSLSEASAVGHIIPDFGLLVKLGLPGLRDHVTKHEQKNLSDPAFSAQRKGEMKVFYTACRIAIDGVVISLRNLSELADKQADQCANDPTKSFETSNQREIAQRLRNLTAGAPNTFAEALQLVWTYFSCLHLTQEGVSFGRMDQILMPFLQAELDAASKEGGGGKDGGKAKRAAVLERAQEAIDSFCLCVDGKVLQNRLRFQCEQKPGHLAMGGAAGPYPQGASMNQWLMQLCVGGTDAKGNDVSNPLTKLFLRAMARLPLNAPCVGLRLHKSTPADIIEEAATTLLSGGAHPVLFNDDKIVPGLETMGAGIGGSKLRDLKTWRSTVPREDAAEYAADGCYENIICGSSWFTLGGFTALKPLELALNQGRTYADVGEMFLLGKNEGKDRTVSASEIKQFQQLWDLYFKHFRDLAAKQIHAQLATLDAVGSVCPAPLLSPLINDCLPKGQDFYTGGARYYIYGPCFIAISSAVNSLYAIKKMVFDKETAVTSLPELVKCLMADWGHKLVEPLISEFAGPERKEGLAARYKQLHSVALAQAKFGLGRVAQDAAAQAEVDALGRAFMGQLADTSMDVLRNPAPATAGRLRELANKYGTEKYPFGVQLQPGCGTFENSVAFGVGSGASADGRRLNERIASDLSPQPAPQGQPYQNCNFEAGMAAYTGPEADKITDGAPIDFNISEATSKQRLAELIGKFAKGEGTNILTITVANTRTMQRATIEPERHDVVRVRQGGWSEMMSAMFAGTQQQHLHRPMFDTAPPPPPSPESKASSKMGKCPFSGM